jgi:hypothetical protein
VHYLDGGADLCAEHQKCQADEHCQGRIIRMKQPYCTDHQDEVSADLARGRAGAAYSRWMIAKCGACVRKEEGLCSEHAKCVHGNGRRKCRKCRKERTRNDPSLGTRPPGNE